MESCEEAVHTWFTVSESRSAVYALYRLTNCGHGLDQYHTPSPCKEWQTQFFVPVLNYLNETL